MGFTLLELVLVVSVLGVMMGVSVPFIRSALKSYHLSAAVVAVSGTVQATRYQAVMYGCLYKVAFNQNSTTYQVSNEPLSGNPPTCAGSFSNVGGAIPWSSSGDVSLSPSTTLQFGPNGIVTATTGSTTFSLTNGTTTEQIVVSGVGNVTVSP
ncbi:MAG TPA: GspH/FimT family pseudopilin [Terriglobia bacterium]|nr:GspH/FimT family pseudopilin [Terriglobia bacterium]